MEFEFDSPDSPAPEAPESEPDDPGADESAVINPEGKPPYPVDERDETLPGLEPD